LMQERGLSAPLRGILWVRLHDWVFSAARRMPSKVNIIPFNSLEHMNPEGFSGELRSTSMERIEEFADRLREENVTVMVRDTQGDEIAAACGQLAGVVIKNNE